MIKIYTSKFINISRFLIYSIIDFLFTFKHQKITENTLLLIRLDAIGDYMLVRNFFQFLKQSKRYHHYKITLCGNIVWKDLAETFDDKSIDQFLWVDRNKFKNNIIYKYKFLNKIRNTGFEVVIDTAFSREILWGDSIVKASKAKIKIGSEGEDNPQIDWKRKMLTNKYYTRLIPQSSSSMFEFYRNKEFFEKVIEKPIEIIKPQLDVSNISFEPFPGNEFVIIFPGAQDSKRRWNYENFTSVIQFILDKYDYDILIVGSKSEKEIAAKLLLNISNRRVFDMYGKTTLPQFAKLISQTKLLISNETSAVHFAAAVGATFICVSNGQRFGRFMPYPKEMNIQGKYIYPYEIENKLKDFKLLSEKLRFDSDLDINSISPDRVVTAISEFL